jgi:hypothetical protein
MARPLRRNWKRSVNCHDSLFFTGLSSTGSSGTSRFPPNGGTHVLQRNRADHTPGLHALGSGHSVLHVSDQCAAVIYALIVLVLIIAVRPFCSQFVLSTAIVGRVIFFSTFSSLTIFTPGAPFRSWCRIEEGSAAAGYWSETKDQHTDNVPVIEPLPPHQIGSSNHHCGNRKHSATPRPFRTA